MQPNRHYATFCYPICWALLSSFVVRVCLSDCGGRASFTQSSRCRNCHFPPVGPVSSTDRDIILACTTKVSEGTYAFVRSIRTTGCKAKIVIFTTPDYAISKELSNCGVDIVVAEPLGVRANTSLVQIRFEWYCVYMKDKLDMFDRVLHVDSRDTFFFGDPFSLAQDRRKLFFAEQDTWLNGKTRTRTWMHRTYPNQLTRRLMNNMIINGGFILGASERFYKFVFTVATHVQCSARWDFGTDQAAINYILYKVAKSQWNYELLRCDSLAPVTSACYRGGKMRIASTYIYSSIRPDPIYVAHQYDRFRGAVKLVNRLCGTSLTKRGLAE